MSTLVRTRWAAIGAAIAITMGGGGLGIAQAIQSDGERATFVPITPCRLIDTRAGSGVPGRQTPLGHNQTHTQNAHGNNGQCTGNVIPNDTTALALNVTAIDATTPGTYLTLWPTGATQPNSSNLNPEPGQPPTPNAVQVSLNPAGQFNIYNFTGNVHVIIDVNGYYIDHNHDDRYYTKTEIDERNKWISIDPLGAHLRNGATVGTSQATGSGIILPNAGGPAFEFGFTMPPDHTPDTPARIEFTWHIAETGCTVNLHPLFNSVSRAGHTPRSGTFGFREPEPVLSPMSVPAVANTSARMTVEQRTGGFGLAPGDAVIVGFQRVPSGNTCTAPLHVTGIRVIYG